ncbi:MAG: transcriptional repressor [Nanoarchaeota archaeon]|nr:transcriptional repressor [Nanoarchaeota archaeon]MBU1270066.1 transcriptional repressor [Nanoarchaeota archaeon]MBU1605005.1 transcriptional repressor [Nanoarchaeota archaeon]MBU2443402.1 transcriptional repressor [Nanoarchaeota archaeon]
MIINKQVFDIKHTRNTFQKLKILEYLRSVKSHPTAEAVYKEVIKQIPTITLATVYRNLNTLAEQGEILRLEVNKEYRYDACIDTHQHFICEECGRVTDSFQEKISKYALQNIQSKNFKVNKVNITFKGICNKCSEVK